MTALAKVLSRAPGARDETLETVAIFCGVGLLVAAWIRAPDFSNRKPRRPALRSFWYLGLVGASVVCEPALAQKPVDPKTVAPEYREAAEKRRAEQIRQHECAHKADEAKVLPRDRTAYIVRCLAEDGPTKTSAVAH
jgi:hypothetical protein